MDRPVLYLLMGLPGSGKTTAAEEIAKQTGAVHLSSDNFRLGLYEQPAFSQDEHDALYKTLDYMCELLLRNGTSVVYDANLNRYEHRLEKYNLARKLHAKTKLYWLQVHRDTAKKRRIDTQHPLLVPQHETPHDMFERIASILEEPGPEETYKALDGTRISSTYIKEQL